MLIGALAVVLFCGTGAATVYRDLNAKVSPIDPGEYLPPAAQETESTPPADGFAGEALTILVIGSDSREGDNGAAVGDDTPSVLADTNMVLHLAADRSRIDLVSIPRDSMVQVPQCPTSAGTVAGRLDMFNSAFAAAYAHSGDIASAVACDMNTVQTVTGLSLDGFVLVEMAGFIDMVDALGGVEMCIPNDMYSREAGLDVQAGAQRLDGETALAFARARKGTGLGQRADLDRVERQQQLMAAMLADLSRRDVFTDVGALYSFASAGLEALTTSPNLASIPDLVGLASSLSSFDLADLSTRTVPVADWPEDPNRVVWTAAADDLWAAMADDEPLPGTDGTDETATAEPGGDEAGAPPAAPETGGGSDPGPDDSGPDDSDADAAPC